VRRRSWFPFAVTLTSGLALLAASRPLAFPVVVTLAFAVTAALRLGLGLDGRRLLGGVALGLVAATALGLGSVFLLHALAGEGAPPLVGLLALCAAAQAVLLLGRITAFTGFLLLLGSSLHLSGAAFLMRDGPAFAWTLLTFVSLVWSLVLLERHASVLREDRTVGAVRHLRAAAGDARPGGSHLATTAVVAGVAAMAGTLLWAGTPRVPGWKVSLGGKDRSALPDDGAVEAEDGAPRRPAGFKTGPDRTATGIRLGDVGRIKRDLTPYFEVSTDDWDGDLRDLYLLGNVVDTFSGGGWYPTVDGGLPTRYPATARAGWWIDLEPSSAEAGHGLRIAFLEGLTSRPDGWSLLFLQSDTVRLRLIQGGQPASHVDERADLKRFAPRRLAPGDFAETRVVEPQPSHRALRAARSDRNAASPTTLQVPPELAELGDIARSIVGDERNPWDRAQRLVQWLRTECRYTLRVPEMGDPATSVLTFVRDVRSGHCEYFASALALMLRSLGHPARVAFGFRGGDLQDDAAPGARRMAIVRGVHAHLWTEMYFQGIGWVRLEPTPPDREATDAETVTRAGETEGAETSRPFLERFLGFDAERHRRFWSDVGRAIGGAIRAAVRFAFGPGGLWLGWPVAALLLAWAVRRERRARLVRDALGAGRSLPPGPYGEALLLLARHGVRRRKAQTAHEHVHAASAGWPSGRAPFERLTGAYERRRFGGRPEDPRDAADGAAALRELRRVVEDDPEPAGP
jgi:transglutaminase-like putative cysteine protease